MPPNGGRHQWAVDLLAPGPDDRLLEIGCGPGVATALVCDRLRGGRLLAVDRSATAVRRAAERNAGHVAAGRLEVRVAAVDELDLPPASLDAAFSVNVNLFWTRTPTRELDLLAAALRPGGRLHVCFGPDGPQAPARILEPIAAALAGHGFVEVAVRDEPGGIAVSGQRTTDSSASRQVPGSGR